MKLYNLICAGLVNATVEATSQLFSDKADAQQAMRQEYESILDGWKFDRDEQTDEHHCEIGEDTAFIEDYGDTKGWQIVDQELELPEPGAHVAIEVSGGMVQNVFADTDMVSVDVYDLDVSDFPDDGEEDAAAERAEAIEQIGKDPSWHHVW